MRTGILTIELHLPGCTSLKEKRGRLKPLLARLHREFNISVAEIDRQDAWQQATIACSIVSNDQAHCQQVLQQVVHWIETSWPDIQLTDEIIEVI